MFPIELLKILRVISLLPLIVGVLMTPGNPLKALIPNNTLQVMSSEVKSMNMSNLKNSQVTNSNQWLKTLSRDIPKLRVVATEFAGIRSKKAPVKPHKHDYQTQSKRTQHEEEPQHTAFW